MMGEYGLDEYGIGVEDCILYDGIDVPVPAVEPWRIRRHGVCTMPGTLGACDLAVDDLCMGCQWLYQADGADAFEV